MSMRHAPVLRPTLFALFLIAALQVQAATYPTGNPRTTDNDDSCDISLLPAATLLLPYFEVDVASATGQTTLVTITNTSNAEQIAHVTLWTDWGYPVIDFPIYLTGYDVQSISLFDVIARGLIAPPNGTGFGSPVGELSDDNTLVDEESCRFLLRDIPDAYVERMKSAFTNGRVAALGNLPACEHVGSTRSAHRNGNAIGYATIDVMRACIAATAEDPEFYDALLFENVLVGDYQQVDSTNQLAESSPLVHIRAVPEGGTAASRPATNLQRTFYSRHQAGPVKTRDGRQPLPSTFAGRWIAGGTGSFQTSFKIWREGSTGPDPSCDDYDLNNEMELEEMVRFDEDENFTYFNSGLGDPPIVQVPKLSATSLADIEDSDVFPFNDLGSVAGWMYFNLDVPGGDSPYARQAWVVASMRAQGRFSADADVNALGNGCSPRVAVSEVETGTGTVIGPVGNPNP
jgi:hypothetical protein